MKPTTCGCCGVVLRLESENEDGNYLQVDGSYHTPWRCRDELARQLAAANDRYCEVEVALWGETERGGHDINLNEIRRLVAKADARNVTP